MLHCADCITLQPPTQTISWLRCLQDLQKGPCKGPCKDPCKDPCAVRSQPPTLQPYRPWLSQPGCLGRRPPDGAQRVPSARVSKVNMQERSALPLQTLLAGCLEDAHRGTVGGPQSHPEPCGDTKWPPPPQKEKPFLSLCESTCLYCGPLVIRFRNVHPLPPLSGHQM